LVDRDKAELSVHGCVIAEVRFGLSAELRAELRCGDS
jgi:hypothetical protein